MARKKQESTVTEEPVEPIAEPQESITEPVEVSEVIPEPEVLQEPPKEVVQPVAEEACVTSDIKKYRPDIEKYIESELQKAQAEIERCDDYINAVADSDRLFTTCRRELYEYKYKLRQLRLHKDYPYVPNSALPEYPMIISDR